METPKLQFNQEIQFLRKRDLSLHSIYFGSQETSFVSCNLHFPNYIEYTNELKYIISPSSIILVLSAVVIIVLSTYFLPLEFHLSRILLHLFALSGLVLCNISMFMSLPATSGNVPFVGMYTKLSR